LDQTDEDIIYGPENDYLEIDAGEIKYLLGRCGIGGLRGGRGEFPDAVKRPVVGEEEEEGVYKVNQVTFGEVWDWIIREDSLIRNGAYNTVVRDDATTAGVDNPVNNDIVLEPPVQPPLPTHGSTFLRTSLLDDTICLLLSRARSVSRRLSLRRSGYLQDRGGHWGGKGVKLSGKGVGEMRGRVVDFVGRREMEDYRRVMIGGRNGRRMVDEKYVGGGGRRSDGVAKVSVALLSFSRV